jgi:hypothetical protein
MAPSPSRSESSVTRELPFRASRPANVQPDGTPVRMHGTQDDVGTDWAISRTLLLASLSAVEQNGTRELTVVSLLQAATTRPSSGTTTAGLTAVPG